MNKLSTPRYLIRGEPGKYWTEIEQPAEVASLIGVDLFAAILKCLRGVDQIRSIETLIGMNAEYFRGRSESSGRTGVMLGFTMMSVLYELGEALKELESCCVHSKITNKSRLKRLTEIRKDWHKRQAPAQMRNQFGFHLGDAAKYRAGLAKKIEKAEGPLEFSRGDGLKCHDWTNSLATDSLLAGCQIEDDDLLEILTRSANTHPELPGLIEELWMDLLTTAGIEIVRDVAG